MARQNTIGEPSAVRDAEARQRIATSLDESLIVEAAAGTGKTTELVHRLVAVLQHGKTTIDRIVAVTFTRKAAGELELRLRQKLDEARAGSTVEEERERLEHALEHLEEAHIGTIHAFCAEILHQRPVEAGIDPAFKEVDEDVSRQLYDRAFQTWIERRLDDMPPGLRRALTRLAGERSFDGSSPIDRLREAGRSLVDWRDFPAAWEQRPWDRGQAIDALLAQIESVAELYRAIKNRHDYLRRSLEPVDALVIWVRRSEELQRNGRDHDALEARLISLLRALKKTSGWKGRGKQLTETVTREEALAIREQLIAALEDFKQAADADLAAHLHRELSQVTEAYEELKRQAGQLDFLDLLIRARDLIRDNAEVRAYLQQRFSHLFVDELQDTDPLQAEILLLLAADDPTEKDWCRVSPVAGKLFLVGDPKQSIYRFRRADVLLYKAIKEQLLASGVGLVHLTCSFRAVEPLQTLVNAAFVGEMDGDEHSGQPDYVALDPYRPAAGEQPPVVVLPLPRPYSPWGRITEWKVTEEQPAVVAAWLAWLFKESGWTVEDPEERGRRVPIAPRHVALLFRRFLSWGEDTTSVYVRELEARDIPHLLVGGRSFHQREEVETLRAALTAIEWPDDELSVFATLKGALFAIRDDLLLRFRSEIGSLHPFRAMPDDLAVDFLPLAEALAFLAELHRQRNRVPIVDSLLRLLEHTRAHAGFALRPAGQQVLANVQHICDLARHFELRGGLSFRGFVELLSAEAEKPGATQAPVLEEGADGVRIMTAHAAKGLEFPVVILADITANLHRADPGFTLDPQRRLAATKLLGCSPWELLDRGELEAARDRAEGVRLAYVAATRARDLLVVPGVGDQAWEEGWVSPLNRALYPPRPSFREPGEAPQCPPFGTASVLARPQAFDGQADFSVRPGQHRPESGEHRVVWWDPAVLDLEVRGHFGLHSAEILSPDSDDREAAARGLERYEAWRDERRAVLERGGVAEYHVLSVTELDEDPPGEPAELTLEVLERTDREVFGRRFGTLVHTVLRDAEATADRATIRSLVTLHGRMLNATESEREAAADSVTRALAHPLLQAAYRSPRCHRETPFVLQLDRGRLVEGTVDLAFLDDDRYVVVDFKTDVGQRQAASDELDERYRRQLAWYVHAIERLTGEQARGVLLGV